MKIDRNFFAPEVTPHAKCPDCGKTFVVNRDLLNSIFDRIESANENLHEAAREKVIYVKCPHCRTEFEPQEILPNLINQTYLTQAIGAAKTILTFDVAIFFFAGVIAVEWWLSTILPELQEFASILRFVVIGASFCWLFSLALIINWFVSYGGLESDDPEFVAVKKSLKMSFALWFAMNLLNVLLLNYQGWFKFS